MSNHTEANQSIERCGAYIYNEGGPAKRCAFKAKWVSTTHSHPLLGRCGVHAPVTSGWESK